MGKQNRDKDNTIQENIEWQESAANTLNSNKLQFQK